MEEIHSAMIACAREELHNLAQPVTAILCVLELAKMQGEESHLREGIDNALQECTRLMTSVQRVRFILEEPGETVVV